MSVRNDNFPRTFDATIRFSHKFRFRSTSNAQYSISRGALLNMLLDGNTTTTASRIIAAVKINQMTIYGLLDQSTFNTATSSLEWQSDLGTTVIKSDTGTPLEPSKIVTGPPANSRASFWSRSGVNESEILFKMVLTTGNIVDFDLSCVLFNDDTPFIVTTTGVVAGQLYSSSINTTLVPVSYPSL